MFILDNCKMASPKTDKIKDKKTKLQKYYRCERCGYITIISNSFCPICAKDGTKIELK